MGPEEDYIETVVTCEGDFHDPQLQERLQHFQQRLERLLLQDGQNQLILKKVEPWNSVRITFNIPREAALRLKQLAEQGNAALRQLGVLGVQIEGDHLVSLTLQTSDNQRAELVFTSDGPAGQAAAAGSIPQHLAPSAAGAISFEGRLPSSSDEPGSPGPSMEATRKNIQEYLRQFNSILPPALGAGPSGTGPGSDIFRPPSHEGRSNNIICDSMPGPSGLGGFQPRMGLGMHGPGAFPTPAASRPGKRGSRGPSHHQRHQQQPQNQFGAQGTALPQTAAVGLMDLPPPPPYGAHRSGVANNVGRQGKKATASSPLLINLLQTDPMAAANNIAGTAGTVEKVKKKRRRRKDKLAVATSTGEDKGAMSSSGLMDTTSPNRVQQSTTPSAEEMSAVLHRRVSPVPLPSPNFGGLVPTEVKAGPEGFRDRPTPTASAALAGLAHNQRATDPDAIINPYTGQLEPRDSASDLSPVKKDQHKAHKEVIPSEAARNLVISSLTTSVPGPTAKTEARSLPSDMFGGSVYPASMKEDPSRSYPSTTVTSISVSGASLPVPTINSSLPQRPGLPQHSKATSSSTTLPTNAQHYAPSHIGPSQLLPRTPHPISHSHRATMNGPVSVSLPQSLSHPLPAVQDSRVLVHGAPSEGVSVHPYQTASHRLGTSLKPDLSHNVTAGDAGVRFHLQAVATTTVTSQAASCADASKGIGTIPAFIPASTSMPATASDSHNKLLNSSSLSPAPAGGVQRLIAECVPSSASTSSPAGSKPSSDGDDNSNHSGTSPVGPSEGVMATSALLDANGTKVDNHDSGVGSSSERSEDTTPSEAGDGEFQTHIAPTDASEGGKPAVSVTKSGVNCKKEGGADLTVGYVHLNQQTAELYHKDAKHPLTESSLIHKTGDKMSREETVMRQVSDLIETTTGSLVEMSASLPSKVSDVLLPHQLAQQQSQQQQQNRLVMKHKPSTQAAVVHQNGPSSSIAGSSAPLPAVLRLPTTSQQPLPVHHQAGAAFSHAPGSRLPLHHSLSSAPGGKTSYRSVGGQGLYHPPSSNHPHSAVGFGNRAPGKQQVGTANQAQQHSLPSGGHGTETQQQATGPGVPVSQSASHMTGSRVPVSSHGSHHNMMMSVRSCSGSMPPANSAVQVFAPLTVPSTSGHTVSTHTFAGSGHGNGFPPPNSSSGMQHANMPGLLHPQSQHSRTPSPSTHAPNHPLSHAGQMQPLSYTSLENTAGHRPVTQVQVEPGVSRPIPSSLMMTTNPVDVAASNALAAAHGLPAVSRASQHQSVHSSHNAMLPPAFASSTDSEFALRGQTVHEDGGQAQGAIRQDSSCSATTNALSSASVNHYLQSLEDMDTNHHAQIDDSVYSPDDDLALLSDSANFVNGSGGVGTEARAGSNITSMYTKRSSPINVNMLTHMYASGLPQPRRLTESIQRLVKPLPNPENTLPPGARACKSPASSSSRHSSNGSASPGRASQGGARSPGASLSPSPGSRAERLASSPSLYAMNSTSAGGGFPPAYHNAQPSSNDGAVNCISMSSIPVAPHPLAPLQSPANRHKNDNGPVSTGGSSGVAAVHSGALTSQQPVSASFPPTPSSLASCVTLSDVATPVSTTGHQTVSHERLAAHNHSTASSAPLPLVPLTVSYCSPPLPALVPLPHPGDVSKDMVAVSNVSSTRLTPPAAVASTPHSCASSHSHLHHPSVSVCNTASPTSVDSTPLSVTVSSSSSLSALTQSVQQHRVTSVVRLPLPVARTVSPHTDLSTQAGAPASHSIVGSHDRSVGVSNSVTVTYGASGRVFADTQSLQQRQTTCMAVIPGSTRVSEAEASSADSYGANVRTIHSEHTYTHIAASSRSETVKVSSVAVSHTESLTNISEAHSATKRSSVSNADNSKPPLEEDMTVPKLENALENHTTVSKERASGLAPLSMPPLGAPDLMQSSTSQGESPHSKPPVLHPNLPLIPDVVPSATPPPPPLTPVLPNDPSRKDSQGHNTPPLSAEGQMYPATLFGVREVNRTASPLVAEPPTADSIDGGDNADSASEQSSAGDTLKVVTADETNGSKATSDSKVTEQANEDNTKTRRQTRKRKPTLSESDSSSSEPAPKLVCLQSESVSGSRHPESSKAGAVSDHPPRLQKEGKRSSEKRDEDRLNKKDEDKTVRREEGKCSKIKTEGSSSKEEGKGTLKEEERGVRKEEKGGKEEEREGSKVTEKRTKKLEGVGSHARRSSAEDGSLRKREALLL